MMLFLIFISFCIFKTNVNAYSFRVVDPNVTIIHNGAGYKLLMPENNHDTDFTRALVAVESYSQDDDPPYLLENPGFNYSIEKNFNKWILYSYTSYDYESDLRYHAINFGVGKYEYTSLMLYIQNIDDEPPVFTCPDDLSIVASYIYNTTYSPLICSVYDPDGFLNQTTFTLKGENKDKFEFILPDVIDPMAQSVEVVLINKVAFSQDSKSVSITVEVKDGAGHNTVPDPEVTLNIQILPLEF